MAKNNLAGLAALGALGMMMSKGSKGKEGADRDTDTGVDVMPSYATRDPLEAANSSQDAMDIRDSLTRGAPGTSETVTPTSKPKVQKSRPRIGGYMSDSEQIARESRPRATPDRVKNLASAFNVPMNPRIQRDELGEPLYKKKGGVIKMAKGGMTSSASRRADGIASKGKTRGKIC